MWADIIKKSAYLGVNANRLGALVAGIGKYLFIAAHAIRVLVSKNVPLPSKWVIALPTAEVAWMPVLIHGFGVLTAEDQLKVSNQRQTYEESMFESKVY